MIQRVLALVSVLLFLFSCATVPVARREDSVEKIVELINEGNSVKLIELSEKPFLFDGEIVMMGQDLELLFNNLAEAGFSLADYSVTSIQPVDGSSYKRFADTMEVRVFFEKYVESSAVIAAVESETGDVLLLLDGNKGGYPQIHGCKVM